MISLESVRSFVHKRITLHPCYFIIAQTQHPHFGVHFGVGGDFWLKFANANRTQISKLPSHSCNFIT